MQIMLFSYFQLSIYYTIMNLKKFKKFALTTKETQQITGGEDYYYCYDAATGIVSLVHESEVGNYPPNHCMIPAN